MLKKINDLFYGYEHPAATFTLKYVPLRIWSDSGDCWGEGWCLRMYCTPTDVQFNDFITDIQLASFVTDDCGKKADFDKRCGKKRWTEDEAVAAADKMIAEIFEKGDIPFKETQASIEMSILFRQRLKNTSSKTKDVSPKTYPSRFLKVLGNFRLH